MEHVIRITYSTYLPSSRQYHLPEMPGHNWEMLVFHLTRTVDSISVANNRELRVSFLANHGAPIGTKDRFILEVIVRYAGWADSPVKVVVTETTNGHETTYSLTVPPITVDNGRVNLGTSQLEENR